MGIVLTTLVWKEVLGGGVGVEGVEEGQGPIQWVEEGAIVEDKVFGLFTITFIIPPHYHSGGYGDSDFYPMNNHMNKMRGGGVALGG